MTQQLTAEELAQMTTEERKRYRARLRRQSQRETGDDAITCQLCVKQIEADGHTEFGTTRPYEARSLITHIREHGIKDGVLGYEIACGIQPGTAQIVSNSCKEVFAVAGAKGAAALAAKRAHMAEVSDIKPEGTKKRKS